MGNAANMNARFEEAKSVKVGADHPLLDFGGGDIKKHVFYICVEIVEVILCDIQLTRYKNRNEEVLKLRHGIFEETFWIDKRVLHYFLDNLEFSWIILIAGDYCQTPHALFQQVLHLRVCVI